VRYVLQLGLELYRLPFSATKPSWAGLSRAGNIAVIIVNRRRDHEFVHWPFTIYVLRTPRFLPIPDRILV